MPKRTANDRAKDDGPAGKSETPAKRRATKKGAKNSANDEPAIEESEQTNEAVEPEHPTNSGFSMDVDSEDPKEKLFSFITEEDIAYEEDCLRSPYTLKCWLRYLVHKQNAPIDARSFIYERALKELPGSYKLWKAYLDLRVSVLLDGKPDEETGLRRRQRDVRDPEWDVVNFCFERSLALCNKFPVIWLDYCVFLMHQCRPTQTRRTFDRALRSLPVTQHAKVWKLYLKFVERVGGETAIRVWRRYLKLEPSAAEDYVNLLVSLDPPRYAEAARVLASIVEDPKYNSKNGRSQFQLWTDLCDLVCDHANELDVATADNVVSTASEKLGIVDRLDVDKILRSGIERFTDQVGKLWNSLARWWILRGEYEKARDVYEEAISKVMTVRDFSMVFDAYAEFEETVLSTYVEALERKNSGEDDDEHEADLDEVEVDLRMARFAKLIERRPFLVNEVLLRQNPHNVPEWEKRIQLFKDAGKPEKVAEAYTQAISTVTPKKAHGKFHAVLISFAKWYEEAGDYANARETFEKAVKIQYKRVDDLAEVWCQYAELELRRKDTTKAREVLTRATAPPRGLKLNRVVYEDDSLTPQQRVFKSLKLWSYYVDIEEAIGTVESTRAIYERILELKIINPQVLLNYATFLEENNWFEDSYKVYERGIELFGFPAAFDIWMLYLTKFIKRYQGTKVERTRDLFENSVDKCPPKYARNLYLMFAKFEEEHGLIRHAMRIYDRATRAVTLEDRLEIYQIYISKATEHFGLTSTREIYQKAIDALPDRQARDMCLKFAELETKLGEIDRARGVLAYCSQFCDPRMDPRFWETWHKFEVNHGNEDTFKEMLRIKRSVQAKYNSEIGFLSAQLIAVKQKQEGATAETSLGGVPLPGSMQALEAEARMLQEELDEQQRVQEEKERAAPGQNTRVVGFVRAATTERKPPSDDKHAGVSSAPAPQNPDEIEIDDSDEDDGREDGPNGVEKREIPAGVFGRLAS
ncbi:hypothetical protein BJ742DRAFT_864568 [Cladochytrium replicatum]|nr:hypothetical protein BJ742DRAFT_864568 [Cladochytrium replicatum]